MQHHTMSFSKSSSRASSRASSRSPVSMERKVPTRNQIIGRSVKTRILDKINHGSFGDIYLGRLVETDEEVVVKLESANCSYQQLLGEGNTYTKLQGGPGIPRIFWFGVCEPDFHALVIEYLGPNLQDVFSYCQHHFSLKTVLMLVEQMLGIIRFVHSQDLIYRDIKPDNFLIGRKGAQDKIYVVDFGLAKKHVRSFASHPHFHMPHGMVGTARYASLNAHRGGEETMRDDLESLAYTWIYLMRGQLPWQNIDAESRSEKFERIREVKTNTTIAQLCEGLPAQFATYLDYTRCLKAEEVPNYRQVKELFNKVAQEHQIVYDDRFDWIVQEEDTGKTIESRGCGDHGHDSSNDETDGAEKTLLAVVSRKIRSASQTTIPDGARHSQPPSLSTMVEPSPSVSESETASTSTNHAAGQ